jgi:hypothetical protein
MLFGLVAACVFAALGDIRADPPPPTAAATDVATTNWPHRSYVDQLLADGRKMIRPEELTPLNEADISALIARYRSIASITNKAGIADALARRGDGRVVDLFWDTLTREYASRRFGESRPETMECFHLMTLVSYLGLQARQSERAFDVLKRGTDPAFWNTNVSWRFHGHPAATYLVGDSINGLSWSGREDAWNFILGLKEKADSAYLREYSGAIMDAAHSHYTLTNGTKRPTSVHDSIAERVAWEQQTSDGQAWLQWYMKAPAASNLVASPPPKTVSKPPPGVPAK